MFVRLFFPKTTFVCFLKCLSVRFFSKLHFAVFGNVCAFIFHQTAFAFLFFNVCPFVLIFIRSLIYQNCNFFFLKCLSVYFFLKLHLSVFRNVCPFVFPSNSMLLVVMFVRSFFS
jgi:hypothetical protein